MILIKSHHQTGDRICFSRVALQTAFFQVRNLYYDAKIPSIITDELGKIQRTKVVVSRLRSSSASDSIRNKHKVVECIVNLDELLIK